MDSISQNVEIRSTKDTVRFTVDMTCLYSRSVIFGETEEDENNIIYCQNFGSHQLNNLGRISGLGITSGNVIQIFTKDDLPMLLKTNVGTLGKINIYIKSKEQVDKETEDDSQNNLSN